MYEEDQKFSFLFMVGVCVFIVGIAILSGFMVSEGDRIMAILSVSVPVLIIVALYQWITLRTTVTGDQLSIRMSPFGGMDIALSDIQSVKVVRYDPIRDFGGWGIRFGRKGRMYNARGNQAVKLIVDGSGTIFVGSQTPEKLAAMLSAQQ